MPTGAEAKNRTFMQQPPAQRSDLVLACRNIERPDGLTSAFAGDPTKQRQWAAFVEEIAGDPGSLADVVEAVAAFLLPHAEKARNLHARR
jgi:hypothetical protein